jgi:NAD(P)-dependent dehydrogenase (short-subunit alcohol dehydrogenase family)
MKMDGRFSDRVAVVTGGASGAGKGIALRLASEGAKVALLDLAGAALDSAADECGGLALPVDVSDIESVRAAMAKCHGAFGRLDLLVCSAGITGATAPVEDYPVDSWRRVVDINLNGVFHCCREAIPFMRSGRYGRIVNIASVAGKEGNPNLSAYSAAKAGVLALTKSLGKELATSGILVNAVTPAVFVTPMLDQMPQSQIDYMKAKIPMGRFGEIDEITAMVCWLLSEECSFSTGAVFDCTGGRSTY